MLISDLIIEQAAKNPQKTALFFREEKMTFAELSSQIQRLAQGLSDLGIEKGDKVALLLRNCPEFLMMMMALSTLGAVSIPINFLEKSERVALILNDAKAVGILSAKEYMDTVNKSKAGVSSLRHLILKDDIAPGWIGLGTLFKSPANNKNNSVDGNDPAIFFYTSGTTGLPKGVVLTHKNFLSNVEQCLGSIQLNPDSDRMMCLLPMFHSFSWTVCVLLPLKIGIPIAIIESVLPFEPIIKAIWKHNITIFVAVPQIFGALANRIKGLAAVIIRIMNPIRICVSGAAPLPEPVLKKFEKNFGLELLEGYGLTECSPVACLNPQGKRKIGTVGRPLHHVTIEIRTDDGQPVPLGEAGEVWVKGDNVMKGYYRKPEETAEVLTKDGWLKTGDIGRFDAEGFLTILDRKKDLIIVKGLNVYPQEVENVILKVASVKEAAVVGKMDPQTGEEIIRAFLTAKEGMKVETSDVVKVCRDDLAPFKRPKEFIVLPELPKNALQKVLKKELRKL